MVKVISILFVGLILSPILYSQPKLFGSKISGNGDIISDVILIQDGFVLDSAVLNNLNDVVDSNSSKYSFEYYEDGKLKRDIYSKALTIRELVNGRYINKYRPGCYLYFYNENGYIDSTICQYWYDTIWVNNHSVHYSYDNNGNLLSNIFLFDGDTTRIEENNYDSAGKLILHKGIDMQYNDTTYNIREYDLQNRLILIKWFNGSMPHTVDQYIYNYDSSGNVNCTLQSIEGGITENHLNYNFEFDENGRVDNEIMSGTYIDSAWSTVAELPFVYDNNGKILEMGDCFYHYNQNDNLDTFKVLHAIYAGYLGNKIKLIDSHGNKITFSSTLEPNIASSYLGSNYFYYRRLTTGVEDNKTNKMDFSLSQNYPNPFNPSTTINYQLSAGAYVTLKVYDILGREIKELVNEFKAAGKYSIQFDGSSLSSGVYFYSITAGNNRQVKKMILAK